MRSSLLKIAQAKRERLFDRVLFTSLALVALIGVLGADKPAAKDEPKTARSITYETRFKAAEDPISESGHWINGKTAGLDWGDLSTTQGRAIGHSGPARYADATALLTGDWGPDQWAEATVYAGKTFGMPEVELRLRSTLAPHVAKGYEISNSVSSEDSAYLIIVRWNGPLADFTYLANLHGKKYGVKNGDVVKATIVGNVISAYKNGELLTQVTDNTFARGNPGIGFNEGNNGDYGFTSVAASDAPAIVQLNDNGAWCWYQDPRAVIDRANNTLLVGSVANSTGAAGQERGGDVDLVAFHLDTRRSERIVLHHRLQPEDDHNTPAILIRPDGRYLAMYSKHHRESVTYWRVSTRPHDAGQWGPEQTFDWKSVLGPADRVTYSNLFYLSAERKTYDFSRAVNLDPSILASSDQGDHWGYAGKLLTVPRLGYVNGYAKYAANGVDRIDFITTEHHPRDFNNSVYHGYLQDGKLHRSDGKVVDADVFHSPGHPQTELTKVFAADTMFGGDKMTHAWTVDLRLDSTNRPYAILSCRANDVPENSNFEDHRFTYARFDGAAWKVHHLAKAGARLWNAEQDYTGLAALDPANPNVVYISTTIDPRDDSRLKMHEIFKGMTGDGGETWKWTAITQGSAVDNLRPVVPAWDEHHTALLWFRGKMTRSQRYDCQIVGLIDRP